MRAPSWLGHRYPTLDDLERVAEDLGCLIARAPLGDEAIYFAGEGAEPPVILISDSAHSLVLAWTLAHELGHLVHHSGPKGELLWAKGEHQADMWAACALIPKDRIRQHRNASEDAFVAALSAHFGDIPTTNCPERRLAGRIARIRLRALNDDPISGQIRAYTG